MDLVAGVEPRRVVAPGYGPFTAECPDHVHRLSEEYYSSHKDSRLCLENLCECVTVALENSTSRVEGRGSLHSVLGAVYSSLLPPTQ